MDVPKVPFVTSLITDTAVNNFTIAGTVGPFSISRFNVAITLASFGPLGAPYFEWQFASQLKANFAALATLPLPAFSASLAALPALQPLASGSQLLPYFPATRLEFGPLNPPNGGFFVSRANVSGLPGSMLSE